MSFFCFFSFLNGIFQYLCYYLTPPQPRGVMVAQVVLVHLVEVRILTGLPISGNLLDIPPPYSLALMEISPLFLHYWILTLTTFIPSRWSGFGSSSGFSGWILDILFYFPMVDYRLVPKEKEI